MREAEADWKTDEGICKCRDIAESKYEKEVERCQSQTVTSVDQCLADAKRELEKDYKECEPSVC